MIPGRRIFAWVKIGNADRILAKDGARNPILTTAVATPEWLQIFRLLKGRSDVVQKCALENPVDNKTVFAASTLKGLLDYIQSKGYSRTAPTPAGLDVPLLL